MTTSPDPSLGLPAEVQHALAQRYPRRIVVFSGAGMSADSGVPTFRSGSNGLWNEFKPGDLATPDAWRRDRNTVWAWYEWRRGLVMKAQPNPGHLAIAELQRNLGAQVITQNVDDLHERAGAVDVLHLHGSLFAARCAACGAPYTLLEPHHRPERSLSPPQCGRCGGYVRPGVVWFGEDLDTRILKRAQKMIAVCDLLVVVGTSGAVYPAAGLVPLAPRTATIIEINPDRPQTPHQERLHWETTAAIGLPKIASFLMGR